MPKPCAEGSAERADAQTLFDRLNTQIRALKPASDHRPANKALLELLAHPCMALADVDPDDLEAEAAPALVEFWTSGGDDWVISLLNLGYAESYSFPPTMRGVVALETRPKHKARSLLCSLADPTCGAETAGWWLRAENAFRASERTVYRGQGVDRASEAICAREALAKPASQRLGHWRQCAAAIDTFRAAMPLGRVRAPTAGWLLVRGRRGHYNYCDEVRLYSLATGAAYIAQSCNQLFIAEGDKVRHGTTTDRRRVFLRGSVPVANIRELVWLLVQADDTEDEHFEGYRSYKIPAGIARVADPEREKLFHSAVSVMSSNQTTLAWALTDRSGVGLSGTLTWPTDYTGGAKDHAVDLLRIAEGGFVQGCPRQQPPRLRRLGKRPAVSPIDGDNEALELLSGDLVSHILAEAKTRCRPPKR